MWWWWKRETIKNVVVVVEVEKKVKGRVSVGSM